MPDNTNTAHFVDAKFIQSDYSCEQIYVAYLNTFIKQANKRTIAPNFAYH